MVTMKKKSIIKTICSIMLFVSIVMSDSAGMYAGAMVDEEKPGSFLVPWDTFPPVPSKIEWEGVGDASITFERKPDTFLGVFCFKEKIDESYYTVEPDGENTKITFKEKYMKDINLDSAAYVQAHFEEDGSLDEEYIFSMKAGENKIVHPRSEKNEEVLNVLHLYKEEADSDVYQEEAVDASKYIVDVSKDSIVITFDKEYIAGLSNPGQTAGLNKFKVGLTGNDIEYMEICLKKVLGEEIRYGDVDENREVKLDDVQKVLKFALLLDTPVSEKQKFIADIDGSGRIELKDAYKVLRISLQLDKVAFGTYLPSETTK